MDRDSRRKKRGNEFGMALRFVDYEGQMAVHKGGYCSSIESKMNSSEQCWHARFVNCNR